MRTVLRSQILALLSGTAAISLPGIAYAQTVPQTAPAPAAPQSADDEAKLPDIVVTAQKRSESLQRVPIAVTAISPTQLTDTGITDTANLAQIVPGLSIGKAITSASTYLRGIGQSTGLIGTESPVATYLDGIYLGAPSASLFELTNVSQIAVLRGPQGTLFGRNSTGGLVQITTRNPSVEPKGEFTVGYGNLNTISSSGYLSGALAPNLAASISYTGHNSFDGYVYNRVSGEHIGKESSIAGQAKFKWTPGAKTEITWNNFYTYSKGGVGSIIGIAPGFMSNDRVTPGTSDRIVSNRYTPYGRTDSAITSLTIDQDLGFAKLSNQASYVHFGEHGLLNQNGQPGRPNPGNAPGIGSETKATIRTFTDELQLQSNSTGPFTWIVGAFYLYEKTHLFYSVLLDDTVASTFNSDLENNSYSAFAQGTLKITPTTRFTGGIRYTKDIRDYAGIDNLGRTSATYGTPTHASFAKPSWRLAIDQDLTSSILAYASYSRGFKAGNFNNTNVTDPPYQPETLDAYEIGVKSDLLDHHLRLNLAGFYYDYRGIQLKANQGASGTSLRIFNAASAEIYGVDIDFAATLSSHFSLTGGAEFLHAYYTSFPGGSYGAQNPVTVVPAGCIGKPNALVGGASIISCDLSGNRLFRAPKFTGNLGIKYETTTNFGELTATVSNSYNSGYFFEADNVLRQPAYYQLSGSIGWESLDKKYSIRLWGQNLTDSIIYSSGLVTSNFTIYPGKPRTFGITFGTKF